RSFDYRGPALLATYRRGLLRWLTTGVRAEASNELASGGLNLALAMPVGEVGASAALSRRHDHDGSAASVHYTYLGRRLNGSPAPRTTVLGAVSTRREGDRDDVVGRAEVQRALPLGPGVGYQLLADVGRNTQLQGEVRAQSGFGRVDALVQRANGQNSSLLRL